MFLWPVTILALTTATDDSMLRCRSVYVWSIFFVKIIRASDYNDHVV